MNKIIEKRSAGGIVYRNGQVLTLNVTKHNEIVFPKGTIEPNEAPEQTAIREILEETGYHVKVIKLIGTNDYNFTENNQDYHKTVTYFLCQLVDENEQPHPTLEQYEQDEGFENLWLDVDEAKQKLTYQQAKDLLEKALKLLD